jgi:hypothetical protein
MPKHTASPAKVKGPKRQNDKEINSSVTAESYSDSSSVTTPIEEAQSEDEAHESAPEVEVLSHAAQRRAKKRKLKDAQASDTAGDETSSKRASKGQSKSNDKTAQPVRQNSVWVGNLSFKTTEAQLKEFFAEAGEVSRIHMPKKSLVGHGRGMRGENRG